MPARTWTTLDQATWLHAKLWEYHDSQRRNTVNRFLTRTFEEWFRAFPLCPEIFPNKPASEALSADEAALHGHFLLLRKTQIRNWYNNRRLPTGRHYRSGRDNLTGGTSRHLPAMRSGVARLVNMLADKADRTRAPQRIEAYQALYPTRIAQEIERERLTNPPPPGLPINKALLTIRRNVTKRLLAAEPQEVQEEIDNYIELWKARHATSSAVDASGEDTQEHDGEERTPQTYQNSISLLPKVLEEVMGAVALSTGWTFCVLAGGPSPAMGGKIYMEQYHFGPKSAAGQVFSEAYSGGDFRNNVLSPFSHHLLSCFPREVREARAIPSPHLDASDLAGSAAHPHGAASGNAATTSAATPPANSPTSANVNTPAVITNTNAPATNHINTVSADARAPAADVDANAMSTNTGVTDSTDVNTNGPTNTSASGADLGGSNPVIADGLRLGGYPDVYGGLDFDDDDDDYINSAFTGLPQVDLALLGTAPQVHQADHIPSSSPPPAQVLAGAQQSMTIVNGFAFPSGGSYSPTGTLVIPAPIHPVDPELRATEPAGPHANTIPTGVVQAPANPVAAPANPVARPNNAMGDISNTLGSAREGGLNMKGTGRRGPKEKVLPQVEPQGRPRRTRVAPARRDQTPEPASTVLKKKRRLEF